MRKLNITIVIGALVAVLGAALVLAYGRSVDRRIADGRETRPVLVAKEQLNRGTLAEGVSRSVELRQVPAAYVPAGALTDLGQVSGLELLGPVPQGGYLSAQQFGAQQGADVVRPGKGKVALAVGVGVTPGVARYVTSGSVVDVFVTYTSGRQAAGRTKLFHSGAKVLSVSVAPPTGQEQQDSQGSGANDAAGQVVAVLEVTPQEAERIVNATTLGSLYLALSADGQEHKTDEGAVPDDVVRDTA